MQKTALTRLSSAWPTARIEVFTDSTQRFPFYADNIRPISTVGRNLFLSGVLRNRRIPESVQRWEHGMMRRHSKLWRIPLRLRLHATKKSAQEEYRSFQQAIADTDLLVVCGMGGVTDVFELYALDLLETIRLVKRNGRSKVVMLGQAFGPIAEDSLLYSAAAEVLPMVDCFTLRESHTSVPLLERLGVQPARMRYTGDDALEAAVQDRSESPGASIGINVRVAPYSEIGPSHLSGLRNVLEKNAHSTGAALVPLPCSAYDEEDDDGFIRTITNLSSRFAGARQITPEEMIQQLHQCRIAVLGSYHAAVFALAQGIPVVGLYRSAYYRDKFYGLADSFGASVIPVEVGPAGWEETLNNTIDRLWIDAPILRQPLQSSADAMLTSGRNAFQTIAEMINQELPSQEVILR